MKRFLILSSLCFIITLTTQAQNSILNSANQSIFNAISPNPKINSSNTPVNNITVVNVNTITLPNIPVVNMKDFVLFNDIYDYSDLIKPDQGIVNNPNQQLFRNNSILNLNSNISKPLQNVKIHSQTLQRDFWKD
jgi:hypothetical protein